MHKCMNRCIKIRALTNCCCANGGEEGTMEDVKRGKGIHNMKGYIHKN